MEDYIKSIHFCNSIVLSPCELHRLCSIKELPSLLEKYKLRVVSVINNDELEYTMLKCEEIK